MNGYSILILHSLRDFEELLDEFKSTFFGYLPNSDALFMVIPVFEIKKKVEINNLLRDDSDCALGWLVTNIPDETSVLEFLLWANRFNRN